MWGFSEVAVVWTHSLLVWTILSWLRKTCNHRLSDQGTYSHTWESRDPERVSIMVSCCCYSMLPQTQTLHMTQMCHFTHLEVRNPRGSPGLHHSARRLETGTPVSFPESVLLGFWLLPPEPAARHLQVSLTLTSTVCVLLLGEGTLEITQGPFQQSRTHFWSRGHQMNNLSSISNLVTPGH